MLKWLLIVFLGTSGSPAFADYLSGKEAYDNGDFQKAFGNWIISAENGNPASQNGIGEMYDNGDGVPEDNAEAVKWYRLAADQGDATGQAFLGTMYEYGEGVPENKAEAVKWYRLAAEQGNAMGQAFLGTMYDYGEGVSEDKAEAVKWYRLAADQGDAKGQAFLGTMYEYGEGVPEDKAEAVRWYRLAAEQGNAMGQTNLGGMYEYGEGVPEDKAEAVKWYRLAAEQGNATGQAFLGTMYDYGEGVSEDKAEAVKWYRLAADQGDATGQTNLGRMYEYGDGVPEDNAEAVKWYRLAADQGDATGQAFLGTMYEYGEGVPENKAEAVKWYRLAAEQGNAMGQAFLGTMYDNGDGVPEDNAEAVKWYRLAAEQGNATGQAFLGTMYDYGEGVSEDKAEAVKWYRLAADQGDAKGQAFLGTMYDNGEGVPEDKAEAVKWYRLAADQGNAKGQTNLGRMYGYRGGVPEDKAEAVKWYRLAADQGDATGQAFLGTMYDYGEGVSEDKAEAVKWYRLAAEQGNAMGQAFLGTMYEYGEGVPEDKAEAVKWYRLAAEQGNAMGQAFLGTMYDYGEGVSEDKAEAVKWYRLAADQGDAKGQAFLGTMYEYGEGVPEDKAEAVRWYRLAAEQGNAMGQTNLGGMYEYGEGVPEDKAEAVKWYRLAAEQGNAMGQTNLGGMYEYGEGVPEDKAEAVKWYRLAADQGNAMGQAFLGTMYDNGDGVPEDNAEAVKWYRLAAEQGNATGQAFLGTMYDYGEGVSEDKAEAVKWYRLAADQGDATGQTNLGRMYEYGDGVPEDNAEAVKWYRLAADQGDATGQAFLGTMYEYGEGVPENKAEAVKWYRLAADQGDATGQTNLGRMYDNGDGVPEDNAEAVKWYRLAADQGDATGQTNLGRMYDNGDGVPEDNAEAVKWYRLAADQGNATARFDLGKAFLKKGSFSKARRLIVRDFKSKAQDGKVDVFDSIRTLLLLAEWNESNGNQDNIIKIYQEIISNSDFLSQSNNFEFIDILDTIAWKLIYLGQYSMVDKVAALRINHLGNEQEFPAEYYNILGGSSLFSGHYLDAEKYFLKAANIELQIVDTLPTYLLLGLGGTYMRLGDYDTSISYLEQAISTETFSKYTELEAQKEGYLPLSLSYWYGDKYNKALNSIRELSRLASKALSIRNRTGMSVWNSSTEEIFALHVAIALDTKNRQSLLSEGFENVQLVSQTSTASATAQMAARFASKSNAVGYLIRQQQDVRAEILSQGTRLNQTLLSTTATDRNSQVLLVENSINLLEDELKQINQAISARFPRYQELVNSKPLSAKGSQSLLSPNEALFTFISEKETEATYAFLVRKDDARAYKIDLSEAQLGEMVAALRSDIDLSDVENIAALPEFDLDLAHDLYSKLLGPAVDMLDGIEHLLVVPTGPMESLPLNLLVTEPPVSEGSDFERYQSAAWLPKRFSVTRLPSVSSLRALRVFATNTQATEPFKGFGDPILDGAAGEVRGLKIVDVYEGVQANTDKVRGLPELPETSGELRLIAKYLNSSEDNLYLRERATETELKSADLSNSRVLGFATHGLVGGELNGLAEPALVLTPPAAGSELDDGLLKASEVAQLKLNADMVLLSACNTASGENLGAEGLSGLARAFIYAGARSLLVSHWSVDSGSAAELTTGLFEALEANPEMGRAEALQSSMMSLASDSENPHYSHPAFWAPFSLIGEGTALN